MDAAFSYHERDFMDQDLLIYYESGKNIADDRLPHGHDFFEFFLISEGRCLHRVNGRTQALEEGDLVFVRDGDVHAYAPYDGEPCTYVNLAFSRRLMAPLTELLGSALSALLTAPYPPTVTLDEAGRGAIMVRMERIFARFGTAPEIARAQGASLIASLFARYLIPQVQEEDRPAWFNELLRAMETPEHIREGLVALHRLSPVSDSQLNRTMHRYLDMTPSDYIMRLRVALAQRYLATDDRSITEIAYASGFSNLSYFNRSFRRLTGMTPTRWRNHRGIRLID